MSNANQDDAEPKSEVTEAVKNADAAQIDKNLHQDKSVDAPEHLSDKEETPFIDKQARTDK